jgi:pimeloyl-ACP methyl ester carboxylesterase
MIMLELLNPTPMDLIRFAAQTLSFRHKVQKIHKQNPEKAYELVAERFCAPPEAARRNPDVERLRDDCKRYFGWSNKEWKAIEPSLNQLLAQAKQTEIKHLDETVKCYEWKSVAKKSRGRILMCHGWEGYAFNFLALIAAATNAGWDVISFDHLAHGSSGGTKSGLPIALSTLLAVAEHIGPVDILVGHSLGGAAAGWAAAHHKIKVKRLILIAPFYDTFQLTRSWIKAHLLSDEMRAGLQTELEKGTSMTFDDFMPDALAQHVALPTMILHDPKDPITAFKQSRKLASLNTNIQLVPTPDAGHVRVLANPECIEKIITFIAKS